MKIATQKKVLLLWTSMLLAAFIFSCYGLAIAKITPGLLDSANQSEYLNCCNVDKEGGIALLHIQTILLPTGPYLFGISVVFLITAFAFVLFTTYSILRFRLYEWLLRNRHGSSKLFNLFTDLFRQGILHPKVL